MYVDRYKGYVFIDRAKKQGRIDQHNPLLRHRDVLQIVPCSLPRLEPLERNIKHHDDDAISLFITHYPAIEQRLQDAKRDDHLGIIPGLPLSQVRNLIMLAASLEQLGRQGELGSGSQGLTLPTPYHFDMGRYWAEVKEVKEVGSGSTQQAECKTVCCVAGLAHNLLGYPRFEGEMYDRACYANFLDTTYPLSCFLWSWIFSGFWNACDNTLQGAITRIRYVLLFGLPKDYVITLTNLYRDIMQCEQHADDDGNPYQTQYSFHEMQYKACQQGYATYRGKPL